MLDRPRLALIEFAHLGHFPNYLRLIIEHWLDKRIAGRLAVVVTPQFAEAHSDVVALAAEAEATSVDFLVIDHKDAKGLLTADEPKLLRLSDFASKAIRPHDRSHLHWAMYNKYAARIEPHQSLLMHFDPCLLPVSMGREAPGPFSGVYFKPSFHYELLANYEGSGADQLQKRQEKFLIARVLKHPQLHRLFCLDPLFAARFPAPTGARVTFVPDPVRLPAAGAAAAEPEAAKRMLGLPAGRTTALFFGDLSRRKGLLQLLDALELVTDDDLARLTLVIAGAPGTIDRALLERRVSSLRRASQVHIVTRLGYIPEAELAGYFRATDLVLAPYQRHVGTSGIALLAAAYQRPLLTQSYGLLGELTRRHRLGLAVDTTRPAEIARALTRMLRADGEVLFDREAMVSFARAHSSDRFAATILRQLLQPSPDGLVVGPTVPTGPMPSRTIG